MAARSDANRAGSRARRGRASSGRQNPGETVKDVEDTSRSWAGAYWCHDEGWARWAIVTDVEWARMAIHLFEFLVPGELKLFRLADLAEAKAWVAEPSPTEASRGLL